jgi:hypothetical protein
LTGQYSLRAALALLRRQSVFERVPDKFPLDVLPAPTINLQGFDVCGTSDAGQKSAENRTVHWATWLQLQKWINTERGLPRRSGTQLTACRPALRGRLPEAQLPGLPRLSWRRPEARLAGLTRTLGRLCVAGILRALQALKVLQGLVCGNARRKGAAVLDVLGGHIRGDAGGKLSALGVLNNLIRRDAGRKLSILSGLGDLIRRYSRWKSIRLTRHSGLRRS